MEGRTEIGLYIHIPFCKAKCFYCDFNSFAGAEDLVPSYFHALKNEAALYGGDLADCTVKTVYIGGGTPSFVDTRYLYEILNTCRQCFNIGKNAEISIETNPGTLTYEKLMAYKSMGINRLSIGLQAYQDSLLRKLGRIHDFHQFLENYNQAVRTGFKNINIDLIFGLPGQTLRDWAQTLLNVIQLGPAHVSCYSLKIEEGTPFGKSLEDGELIPIEDELDREMYYMAIEKMGAAGLKHYEISNFARPGYQCRHNLIYWKAEEYLGLGAGAHSYLFGERYNNVYGLDGYIKNSRNKDSLKENVQIIGKAESMAEYMILGLRLTDGIHAGEFKSRYGEDLYEIYHEKIHKLLRKNLLVMEKDGIKLSSSGMDLANTVFMEFI